MSELSLKISGERFEFFNKFNVSLIYNSVASTFSFEGLIFNQYQNNLFRPLSYHNAEVLWNNEVIITGTILNTSTAIDGSISLGGLSGYSKPGVLEDCEIPLEVYPLQSDRLTLKEITEKIIKPFGLKLIVSPLVADEVNKIFDKTTAKEGQKIKEYLSDLCKSRNIIMTHDTKGNVLFTKLELDKPSIATYIEGMPSTRISLSVNGQAMHSNLTVQRQASIGTDVEGEQTISNSLIKAYRPTVQNQSTGTNSDTALNAEMLRASELRSITLTIETDRWKWTDGKIMRIIKPSEIIEVESPSNYLNKRTRFFVERVDFKGDTQEHPAVLTCVLPEVYNGNAPKNIFT